MNNRPSIENAPFNRLEPIVIDRAEAGGFIISLRAHIPGNMNRTYAACSTADEAADLVRDMLREGSS